MKNKMLEEIYAVRHLVEDFRKLKVVIDKNELESLARFCYKYNMTAQEYLDSSKNYVVFFDGEEVITTDYVGGRIPKDYDKCNDEDFEVFYFGRTDGRKISEYKYLLGKY